jgi:hypothetical protein
MNFPDQPLFHLLYFVVNTAGVGSLIVALIALGSLSAYFMTLRWIRNAAQEEELEEYAYPTPSLHHQR